MTPKKKKKGRGRRSKTPSQTSASDPKPTATSPSTSSPTSGATTTSRVPSSASQITTTQSLPSASLLSILEAHQERISGSSDGATTTDLAGPSNAPTASAASKRTPTLLPIKVDFMSLFDPAAAGTMAFVQSAKKEDAEDLHLDDLNSALGSLLGLANKMKGKGEMKMGSQALANRKVLKRAVGVVEKLAERIKNLDGSGGSCGGSKGEGGGPDSGSGEGDGEGGGVSV